MKILKTLPISTIYVHFPNFIAPQNLAIGPFLLSEKMVYKKKKKKNLIAKSIVRFSCSKSIKITARNRGVRIK